MTSKTKQKMEDDLQKNGRQPQNKIKNGRQPQQKMEDDLNKKMEDDLKKINSKATSYFFQTEDNLKKNERQPQAQFRKNTLIVS